MVINTNKSEQEKIKNEFLEDNSFYTGYIKYQTVTNDEHRIYYIRLKKNKNMINEVCPSIGYVQYIMGLEEFVNILEKGTLLEDTIREKDKKTWMLKHDI